MILTTKIKKLLKEKIENNETEITVKDFWRYYSSQTAITTQIERLLMGNILIDIGTKFKINMEEVEKWVN